jgi:hypothetical protein
MSPYEVYMAKCAAQDMEGASRPSVLSDVASNLATGLMTGSRGGAVSLIGGSLGGVVDGLLVRPLIHGALGLAEQGIAGLAGSHGEG